MHNSLAIFQRGVYLSILATLMQARSICNSTAASLRKDKTPSMATARMHAAAQALHKLRQANGQTLQDPAQRCAVTPK